MNVDLRSVVIFLHMQGNSAQKINNDINHVFKKNVIAYSTVTKYIRNLKFTSNDDDDEKSEIKSDHFFEQDVILKVLRDFPFSSIREIADMTEIPKTTVHRILTVELNYIPKHLRWVPHILNYSQKVARVEIAKSLLKKLQKARQSNFIYFYTGDESWFYLTSDHDLQWLPADEIPPTRAKKMISDKKYMLTIFWNANGFTVIDVLPDGIKFNSEYFINNILEDIYKKTTSIRKNSLKKITVHFDNARPHTSRKVNSYFETHQMKKAPHPPYSPDLAPSDFFLFGFIKSKLLGAKFDTVEDLKETIEGILDDISPELLNRVFLEWEERLLKVINSKGDYI